MRALTAPGGRADDNGARAWERLSATAVRLGITVTDGPAGRRPWPDERIAAVVSHGQHIAVGPGLDDAGLRADVLAMALIVAAVMGDRVTDHPCAITAPAGCVLVSRTRAPRPTGPGEVATRLARACGRDIESAAFEYTAPVEPGGIWAPWTAPGREWRVPQTTG